MLAPSTRQLSARIDMIPGNEDEEHGQWVSSISYVQCAKLFKDPLISAVCITPERPFIPILPEIAWDCRSGHKTSISHSEVSWDSAGLIYNSDSLVACISRTMLVNKHSSPNKFHRTNMIHRLHDLAILVYLPLCIIVTRFVLCCSFSGYLPICPSHQRHKPRGWCEYIIIFHKELHKI